MADEELQEEQESKSKGSGANNIKLIIGGIVIIILATGISFGVAKYAASSVPQQPAKGYSGESKMKTETIGTVFDAGEYTTNLAGGTNFIKVKVALAFENKEMEVEVENKLPVIQHTINQTLREQTKESLNDPKGMERLAEKLKKNINELMVSGNIESVYFTYFVVQ